MKQRYFHLIFWLFVLLASWLISCTPEKRLKRILKKNPDLIHLTDQKIIDSTFIKGFHVDSTFYIGKSDTFVITKDNIITKVFYHNNTDTIRILQDKKDTTITKEINVKGQVIYQANDKYRELLFSTWIGIASAILILFALRYFKTHSGNK